MPNRTIREGFLDSPKIDLLDWFAECVYHRMLLAADHAGRLDGRSSVLKSRLFPLKARLREEDIRRAVNQILKAGLAVSWTAPNGQDVLQVTNWHRDTNAVTSRFPDREGQYEIRYIRLPASSQEGWVHVVDTSIPSASHPDGIGMGSASHPKTSDDKTIDDKTTDVGRRTSDDNPPSVRSPPVVSCNGQEQEAKSLWQRYGRYWPHHEPRSLADRQLLWRMCYLAAQHSQWARITLALFEDACSSQKVHKPGAMLKRIRLNKARELDVRDADEQMLAVPLPEWLATPRRCPSNPSNEPTPSQSDQPLTREQLAEICKSALHRAL